MAEKKVQDISGKKKDKPVVKKVVGNVKPPAGPVRRTPDKPAYQHG